MVVFSKIGLAALFAVASAKEKAVNMTLKAEIYDTGIRHEEIMSLKHVRNATDPPFPLS